MIGAATRKRQSSPYRNIRITDAFSLNHSLPYSFVGIQSIYLAITFNPIYWNTACLIVNSGSIDPANKGSTDYGKIAKAIGDIQEAGIKMSLANINKSDFGFVPDVENNRILFGLKGMLNVGDDIVLEIINKRPYVSAKDFWNKVKPSKQAMISLIKGGAFDEMEDRKFTMAWYIWETCNKKSRITLQNMNGLIKYNLLPDDTEEYILAKRVYEFNRYLKTCCAINSESYLLDDRAYQFLIEIDCDNLVSNDLIIGAKRWDKVYQKYMDTFRHWISENKEEILYKLNKEIFLEDWMKYAQGNLSSWEMEVLCFYYHDHELINLNKSKYGINNFYNLPENPVVEKTFQKGQNIINLFRLSRICGTCISKDKAKSTVTLLTPEGVVNVKFRKEYFSLFDKQISKKNPDGTKSIVEKSWFNRGNMIIVNGMRSGDDFISKKYASTGGHQLYKINKILPNGDLILQDSRYQGESEDEN